LRKESNNEENLSVKSAKREEIFTSYPLPKAIASLAIPTMLGMLVVISYNLADTFFIGQLNDPNQVAAITITFPSAFVVMAFGNIFGVGASSYISRLLGMQNYHLAKQVSAFAFYGCILVGVLVTILSLIFMPTILYFSGASENTYQYAYDYLSITMAGTVFQIIGFTFGQVLRSEGAIKEAMIGMMVATGLNIIFDPIFIFLLGMGVKGAAMATVLSNIIVSCYYIHYLLKKSERLSILPSVFKKAADGEKFHLTSMNPIYVVGLPASLGSLLMGISNGVINNFAANYGDKIVGALGLVNRINSLPILLIIGLCQGAQPLIGFNYGAKNYARLRSAIVFTASVGSVLGVAFVILFYFQATSMVKIFIDDAELVEIASQFLRIAIIPLPFLSTLFTFICAFQAMGKAVHALILSIARQGLFFMPAVYIADAHFGYMGLIFAQPIADILSILVATGLFIFISKSLYAEEAAAEAHSA